ncbi:hypothetical protein D1646_02350 [Pseudoflavonifractor sp. 60]|uniref:hypothetical protein n=1 Tax=Pseudoflavonifractor sp. 60 TaxID=2304576 RepID=UPI00136E0FA2|nr:hypothetical protein [Pseudoflavonifractor sp. 60]NBI65669.1 hypothetical protein [Pseudoflavonifractor sp. 60]
MCKVMEDMRRAEREEGIKEGIEVGIKEGIQTMVLRMLERGSCALEEIAQLSGLSLEEVKQLQARQSS